MHLNEITKSSDLVYQAKIFHVTKDTAELDSIPTISANVFRAKRFASRAALTSAPKVSKPGQSSTFAI